MSGLRRAMCYVCVDQEFHGGEDSCIVEHCCSSQSLLQGPLVTSVRIETLISALVGAFFDLSTVGCDDWFDV